MKKILLLVSFLLAISNVVFSQINPEVLTYVEGRYYYQNKIYSDKKLSPVLEVNPKAYEVYKKYLRGRRTGTALMALAIVGGSVLIKTGDPCKDVFDRDESYRFPTYLN